MRRGAEGMWGPREREWSVRWTHAYPTGQHAARPASRPQSPRHEASGRRRALCAARRGGAASVQWREGSVKAQHGLDVCPVYHLTYVCLPGRAHNSLVASAEIACEGGSAAQLNTLRCGVKQVLLRTGGAYGATCAECTAARGAKRFPPFERLLGHVFKRDAA
jgi:hypothetical protein